MKKSSDAPFYRQFIKMTLTLALQNLVVFGVNLADSVMLGSYSELALNSTAICNQVQFFLQMASMGITNGLIVIASQYWGQGKSKPIHKIYAVAFWVGLAVSAVITAFAAIAPHTLLSLFTNETNVIAAGVEYLDVIKYSYVIFLLTTLLVGVMRSVEKVKIGFYVSLSSLAVNIVLNYGLIYGKLGMPEMGIRGAALATLIARALEFVVICIYVFVYDKRLKLRLASCFDLSKDFVKDYFHTGSPLIMSSVSWGIAMGVQGAIIGHLGETAIGANSIASTIFQVATVICYPAGNAACVLVGKTIGENKPMSLIKSRCRNMQLAFLAIGFVSSAILLLCKNLIIDYYNVSADTTRLTDTFIYILSVTIIGTAYEAPALTGIVSGGGETDFVFKNDIIFMWCIVLPLSLLSAFVFKWPVPVTFALLKADQVLKCAVAAVKVNRYKWVRVLTK